MMAVKQIWKEQFWKEQKAINKLATRKQIKQPNKMSTGNAQAAESIFAGVIHILVPSFGFNWACDASFFICSF